MNTNIHMSEAERSGLFIDGAALFVASRRLGYDIDFRSMLAWFRAQSRLVRAYYYAVLPPSEEPSPLRPLTDWLSYNGYTVVTKPGCEFLDSSSRRRWKGSVVTEMATDMLEATGWLDHIVLVADDVDFRRVVETVQRRTVRVSVISSLLVQPLTISDELRRQADTFIELAGILPNFTRRSTSARMIGESQ